MGKRRRKAKKNEVDASQKPWCFYCDRSFADEKILIQHQKHKHFKCELCGRKLGCAKGLQTHGFSVHKETIKTVPNALEERNTFEYDIYGMIGVPEGYLQARRAKMAADGEDNEQQEVKRQKLDYTLTPLPQDLIPPFAYGGYASSYPAMPMQQGVPPPFHRYGYAQYAPVMGMMPTPHHPHPHPAVAAAMLGAVPQLPANVVGAGATPTTTAVVVDAAVVDASADADAAAAAAAQSAPINPDSSAAPPSALVPATTASAQTIVVHPIEVVAPPLNPTTAVTSGAVESVPQKESAVAQQLQQAELDAALLDVSQPDGGEAAETQFVYGDDQVSVEEKRAMSTKAPPSSNSPNAL